MKKTFSFIIFLFFICFLSTTSVKAASCSLTKQNELSALATNIKYNVEPTEKKIYSETNPEEYDTFIQFNVQLFNITEKMKLTVYDDYSKQTKTYSYSNVEDNVLTILSGTGSYIVKFKINIYGTEDCSSTLLRTIEVKTPMVNPYRYYANCESAPEHYLCQEYLAENYNYTYHEASYIVQKYVKEKEETNKVEEEVKKTFFQQMLVFLGKYWWTIFIILLIIGITVYIIIKIRRKRIV